MVKRCAADNSDGAGAEHDTRAKRARVEKGSVGNASPIRRAKNASQKSKTKAVVEDEDDDDLAPLGSYIPSTVTADQDDDDEEVDQTGSIPAQLMSIEQDQSECIAQRGIIESIEMHQFMCHRRLSFKFGPKINFIIGHNGSGKSAVLSALTIGLGGKAISTGRANGLKSFIREGERQAEVTIRIKNQGEDAFRHHVYGDSIFITRRFTAEGASSYRIKNVDGKFVSTKRDELSAICDHMNIQVDNPMNILTQDSARQFLSASHPTDKYQFFLRGTQLTQLYEEYVTCQENNTKARRTLDMKREEIPDLERAFQEADARNKEATKARKKQETLQSYKHELAWAHVKIKEDELAGKLKEVAKARRRLPRIEQNIEAAETAFKATAEKVVAFEAERDAIPSADDVRQQLDDTKQEIILNKAEIRDCRSDETNMNDRMKTLTNDISTYEKGIRERAESQGDVQAERDAAKQRLQAARRQFGDAKEELAGIANEPASLRGLLSHLRDQGKQVEADIAQAQRDIESACANIEQCKHQGANDLILFGNDLDAVMLHIQGENWYGDVPVGPFGRFVTVKDAKWATVMRIQLGNLMNAFVITDNRDRYKLRQMLDRHRNTSTQIIISEVDLFDYSRGEPPEDVLTALRALDIEHEFVKCILINMKSIERVVLADTRADGDRLLLHLGGAGVAWTGDSYIARRYPDGGGTSIPMQLLFNHQDPRHHMFTSTDRSTDIKRWENMKTEAGERLQVSLSRQASLRQQFLDAERQHKTATDRETVLRAQVNQLSCDIVRLEGDPNLEAPVTMDGLEDLRMKCLEEKRSITEQFEDVRARRIALDNANASLLQRRDDLDRQYANWEASMQEIKTKVMDALDERIKATKNRDHWAQKLVDEGEVVDELEDLAQLLQTEFQEWSGKAELIGPQVENPRKPELIKRQIESLQKALIQNERQQGASSEEIAVERDNAEHALETHKSQLKEVENLITALRASLHLRVGKWKEFRQYMAVRCKDQFQYHIFTRGYYGKLLFDHEAGTLNLTVQTEDQASTQSKDKDPKSLSGGEKSYSTICLLLAMWETIQCPIRCLDEFDVFMDPVNRRISMKMMVETANKSDKQYILITPQDMSHVRNIGSSVKVHRMQDPERNQTILPF